ncbi:unnamed protein product [Closterium sp. Yama58-4]|nr:unnamed protein product [Closterium sp. Yama58-4]
MRRLNSVSGVRVYGILSCQLLLTFAAALVVVKVDSVRVAVFKAPHLFLLASAIISFILMYVLSAYRQHHPLNLILLSLFSLSFSITLGFTCALFPANIVLEAILLTTIVVVSLTLFTFWAARNGEDFSWLRPILFTALIILLFSTIIQVREMVARVSEGYYSKTWRVKYSIGLWIASVATFL